MLCEENVCLGDNRSVNLRFVCGFVLVCLCLTVTVRERERVCVCACMHMCLCVCVNVCVCVQTDLYGLSWTRNFILLKITQKH